MTAVNVGDDILAVQYNRIVQKPMCRLVQFTTGTSVPDNTNTALSFDSEEYDTHNMHSTSVNPTRVTIQAGWDGIYLCKGTIFVPTAADYNTIGAVIAKNGANQAPWERVGPNNSSAQRTASTEARLSLVAGDYIELVAYQDNTANTSRTTPVGSSFEPVLEVEFLRDPP